MSTPPHDPTDANTDTNIDELDPIGVAPTHAATDADAPIDWTEPTVTAAADEVTAGHVLEGEGSRTAARAYNDAATAFAHEHPPQATAPTAPAASSDVQVVFAAQAWHVEDPSLPKPLEFTHLADAEQRANELAKARGVGVCVRGEDGDVVSTYSAAHPRTPTPAPVPTTLPRLSDMPLPQQQTAHGPPRG